MQCANGMGAHEGTYRSSSEEIWRPMQERTGKAASGMYPNSQTCPFSALVRPAPTISFAV